MSEPFHRAVSAWLGTVCLLVVAMLVVGGITRLTGSGLSIVEWRPVTGAVPPLSDAAWRDAFEAYQTSPQYRLVNAGMTLDAFKRIYAWEYAHRLLGRVLGLVFLVPWAYFAVKGALSRTFTAKLLFGFGLGGMQGALGWLMVASGLVDVPHVSHYRLAAHLALALVVLGYLFWIWLDLRGAGAGAPRRVRVVLAALAVLLAVQIVYGAFTAGLHAGVGYNTFPKMHGAWVPVDAMALSPAWRNVVGNPALVQFIHRAIGALIACTALVLVVVARGACASVRRAIGLVVLATLVQFGLGVATLVLVVPLSLAALHQLGGCVLYLATLYANHEARCR